VQVVTVQENSRTGNDHECRRTSFAGHVAAGPKISRAGSAAPPPQLSAARNACKHRSIYEART
jgi:hypothetical protein